MREVKVQKEELLKAIRDNREVHIKDYKEACQGYRKAALQKIDDVFDGLRKRVNELKEGQVINLMAVQFDLDVPQSHEKDYDQAIRMLEMSVDETITLQSGDFSKFVMDDWAWKESFNFSKSLYNK